MNEYVWGESQGSELRFFSFEYIANITEYRDKWVSFCFSHTYYLVGMFLALYLSVKNSNRKIHFGKTFSKSTQKIY